MLKSYLIVALRNCKMLASVNIRGLPACISCCLARADAEWALIEALGDRSKFVRLPAACSLGKIGGSSAATALTALTNDMNQPEPLRQVAIWALAQIREH